MVKKYRVVFTPEEPFFFGNEKTFTYPGQRNSGIYGSLYYIRSESIPSQSTLLGALRYMMLPVKRADYKYTDEEIEKNREAVGTDSFDIGYEPKYSSEPVQTFGVIKSLSPVYIVHGEDIVIPAPMDHKNGEINNNGTEVYHPFSEYAEIRTLEGRKLYALDYNAKKGTAVDKYMIIGDSAIIDADEIFIKTTRVGINRAVKNKGMFKKEFCMLEKGYSFAIDVDLDYEKITDNIKVLIESGTLVYLGQNKSVFTVRFTESDLSIEDVVRRCFASYRRDKGSMLYVLGDALAIENMYENTLWASVTTRDYRSFKRNQTEPGIVDKGTVLYKMVRAGSVIMVEDCDVWLEGYRQTTGYENARNIGYCSIITI